MKALFEIGYVHTTCMYERPDEEDRAFFDLFGSNGFKPAELGHLQDLLQFSHIDHEGMRYLFCRSPYDDGHHYTCIAIIDHKYIPKEQRHERHQ